MADSPERVSAASPDDAPRQHKAPLGWSAELLALCCLIAMVAVGQALFDRNVVIPTLGVLGGFVAGLGARRWWSAAIVALIGLPLGGFAASFLSSHTWGSVMDWMFTVLAAGAVAAVIGAIVVLVVRLGRVAHAVVVILALLAVVVAMWTSAIALAQTPMKDGTTAIEYLSQTPQVEASLADESLGLIWISELKAGKSYYPMAVRLFDQLASAQGSTSIIRIRSPFTYRPPTLYALLSLLPQDGLSFVLAMMACCTLGVIACYVLVRQFAGPPIALTATIFVASLFTSWGSSQLMDTETWAGVFGLCAVGLFVLSRSHEDRRTWLNILAVLAAMLATAFRELAISFVLLGLVATVVDPQARKERAWIPWAAGLGVVAVGLAIHWFAAAQAYASVTGAQVASSWFDPDGSGLVGAMFLVGKSMLLAFGTTALLLALAMVGSLIAPRDWASRIMLAGVVIGGAAVLFLVHPPGWTAGNTAPGYWGDMVSPTIIACVPLAFGRLVGQRNGAFLGKDPCR